MACGKSAVKVPGVVGTGVDDAERALPAGRPDPHYSLIKHPDDPRLGTAAFIVDDTRGPIAKGDWALNDLKSKWIGPLVDPDASYPEGEYRYVLEFDLSGFDPATAEIRGRWMADDQGVAILLNDIATGEAYEGYDEFSGEFVIKTGFLPDKNRLVFIVANRKAEGVNPSGLRVELSGSAKQK